MQPSSRHRGAESQFRELIRSADLAQPDDVEYTPESVIFRWYEPQVAVVVDLDDPTADHRLERAGSGIDTS